MEASGDNNNNTMIPPSDEIATSAAKLDESEDATAIRTTSASMDPVVQPQQHQLQDTAIEQQQQEQQQPQSVFPIHQQPHQDSAPGGVTATPLVGLHTQVESVAAAATTTTPSVYASSATGDESAGEQSNNTDNEAQQQQQQQCVPVHHRNASEPITLAVLDSDSGGAFKSTTPTHKRSNSDGIGSSRRKRLCRFPGCTRVIKSQGHCQRHGARAKRCKVKGCEKQAQGTHDGMCKRHWREKHFPDQAVKAEALKKKSLANSTPPPPFGESVYDNILPASIAYRPSFASHQHQQAQLEKAANASAAAAAAAASSTAGSSTNDETTNGGNTVATAAATSDEGGSNKTASSSKIPAMPLVIFLKDGALNKEVGWHRQAERRARGIFPVTSLSVQLEAWEKQLALVEILLLSGGTPHADFKHLAYAWGRERGFHQILSSSVCTRRGEVERKKRSDAGKKQVKQQPKSAPATTGVGPTAAPDEGPPPKDYQPTQSTIPPVPAPVNFASPPGLSQSQITQVAQDIDGRQEEVPWSQEHPPLHSQQQQQGPQGQLQVQPQPSGAGQPIHSNNSGNAIEIIDATNTAAAVGNDNQGYQGNQTVI